MPLGMAIRGRGPRDTNELLSVLMEFEESTSFCERRREETNTRPPFQNQINANQQPRRDIFRRDNNRYQPRAPVHENPVPRVSTSDSDECLGKCRRGSCVSTLRHEASVSNTRTPPTPVVVDGDRSKGKRPGLPITNFNKQFNALLDSGAAISAISEEKFESIKRNIPRGECLSILPVTGVTISTAVRNRSRIVKAQVLKNPKDSSPFRMRTSLAVFHVSGNTPLAKHIYK